MLDFYDVEQNSEEWFELRAGKLTSSNLAKVMANFGKAFGEPAKKLASNIALEQITGRPVSSDYSNEHMERGHIEEPIARELYEIETFSTITNGGFFCNDLIGCSPDGLVNGEGVIEIKSAIPNVHFARISKGTIDSAYKWQCIQNLDKTGRDWLDFVSYCADFPEGKQLFIYRLHRADIQDEIKMIDARTAEFFNLVSQYRSQIETNPYYVRSANA